MKAFLKTLSANDLGLTGGHMAGILVPKGDGELLSFLPRLDASVLNPSTWIDCELSDGSTIRLRFVYYNNRLHTPSGTRNEYRITHLTRFLRDSCAKKGDLFEISKEDGSTKYRIRVIRSNPLMEADTDKDEPIRIKLTASWQRLH